jgi:penicillin G amidase
MGAEPEGIGLELGLLGELPSVRSACSARANDMAGTLSRALRTRRIFGDTRAAGAVGSLMRTSHFYSLFAVLSLSTLASSGCSDDGTASTPSPPVTTGTPPGKVPEVTGPLGERADLPVDDKFYIKNLSAPVDIVRDSYGRPHIYAATVNDAMRVQGFLIAQDRHLQLEFLRRAAQGRLAEILGQVDPSLIDLDISYRHIGLGRVAKAQYDALPEGELRGALDAFADGVTQVFSAIRIRQIQLPSAIIGLGPEIFTDWTGSDSLAIGRLQSYLLSFDADQDIRNQLLFEAARKTFAAADPDPQVSKRAGLERDLFRFAPANPTTTSTGYPAMTSAKAKAPARGARALARNKGVPNLAGLADGYLRALEHSRELLNPDGFGSNNWAVAPSRSANGHAMVASDPHLPLGAPGIFWPVAIDVADKDGKGTGFKVSGVAFPGIPGIILGHNEHIAWGATVAGYDVSDAYAETLTEDGEGVMWKGTPVPLQTIEEVINIQGGAPYTYKVKVVPHHGPIQPTINSKNHTVEPLDPKAGAVSIRWTGLEATNELDAILGLHRARDVDEARQALKSFEVGAQNWMLGDTSGNVLWTSHAFVPIRDPKAFQWDPATYQGTLPCMVLPGDGSAEWTGKLPDDLVPWAKNPAAGFIATANNDPIGDTLDNNPANDHLPDGTPMYLHCAFDIGFREGRIQTRLKEQTAPFSRDDLASIQGDVRSAMGAALTPALLKSIDEAEEERQNPGSHPALAALVKDPGYTKERATLTRELLAAWGKDADYKAAAGIDLATNQPYPEGGEHAVEVKASQATLIFNAWLVRVIERTLGDELDRMGGARPGREDRAKAFLRLVNGEPTEFATYDTVAKDSSLWDDISTPPPAIETRPEQMIRALIDAWSTLDTLAGTNPATYRWGAHHKVKFTALVALFDGLSIPPGSDATFVGGFPRPGDSFSVDSSDFGYGKLTSAPNFTYAHGPAQRFVIELDPAGPKAQNALPGGAVWDPKSPHFRDEAELWRKNQTHPVPFLLADVIAAKEKRTVATAP